MNDPAEAIDALVRSDHFDPAAALAAAYEVLSRDQHSDAAHFVAFKAHAEIFATNADKENQDAALGHYRRAIALNRARCLFPERYVPSALLGVGAFAYVFKVAQPGTAALALKVFKKRILGNHEQWTDFTESLRKLSECGSPYVAKIYDIKAADNSFPPYYVMEFVDGISLREWITTTSVTATASDSRPSVKYIEILDIAIQIASGLEAAHRCGVLHLDLKPENVLLIRRAESFEVKLVDFNCLSMQRGGLPTQSLLPLQATLRYTAPEVIDNIRLASYRSDVYALALLVVEMARGKGGLDPRTFFDELSRLAEEEPAVAVFVLRCLERDPARRPPSYSEVAARLRWLRNDLEQREREREEITGHAAAIGLRPLFGLGWEELLFSFIDWRRHRRLRKFELAVGALVPAILLAMLVHRQFGVLGHWHMNWGFLPCFLAASSFTLLEALYYFQVVFRCEFWDDAAASMTRFTIGWFYGIPVWLGAEWPTFWPTAAAGGLLMVGVMNIAMWHYAARCTQNSPDLLTSKRAAIVATLRGYGLWALIYTLALVVANFTVGSGLNAAFLVVLVNAVLYFTKVHGDTAKSIWKGLRLEYSIRARIDDKISAIDP